jgi:Fic family protein
MRQGRLVTNLTGKLAYQSFLPAPLPPTPPLEINETLQAALIEAHKSVALLQVRSGLLPDYRLFISSMMYKESLLSSQMEGTVASLEDLFSSLNEDAVSYDTTEVLQYFKALEEGSLKLKTTPFSQRFMRELHATLMQGQRGAEKSPGEFRRSQNWIGRAGSSLKEAVYVPPHPSHLLEGLSQLERFTHDDPMDPLLKLALIHYQFETLHPFLDGNGRIGRIIIVLLLQHWALIEETSLPISYMLKRQQQEYYHRLNRVQTHGEFEEWVMFFLQALTGSANHASMVIDEIQFMIGSHKAWIIHSNFKNKQTMLKVYEFLLKSPIIHIPQTAKMLRISFNTVASIVKRMEDHGILVKGNTFHRNRLYVFRVYLDHLREGT